MLSHLLSHPNPSSSEELPIAISYLTCLEMVLGDSIINYMSRVHCISQSMQGVLMDKIIPLFTIESLDHDRYPGVKIWYLACDPALVNSNRLDISGILYREETRHQSLGLPISTNPATVNHVSDAQSQPPLTGRPQPRPIQPTTSPTDYPPPRGVPW